MRSPHKSHTGYARARRVAARAASGAPLPMAALMALTMTLPLVAPVAAQGSPPPSACEFVLGFRSFREKLGAEIVGNCAEEQRSIAGGAEQQTTRGLLAWDAATNRIAFTDGYYTWVGGPNGIERRRNSDVFAWERQEQSHAAPQTLSRFGEWLSAYARATCVPATCEATPPPTRALDELQARLAELFGRLDAIRATAGRLLATPVR